MSRCHVSHFHPNINLRVHFYQSLVLTFRYLGLNNANGYLGIRVGHDGSGEQLKLDV